MIREEALLLGLKRYHTDRVCRNGHTGERIVKDDNCAQCARDSNARYASKNISKIRQKNSDWHVKNKSASQANSRKWKDKNSNKVRAYTRKSAGLPDPTRECPPECEICGKSQLNGKRLALDHDHESNQFRGWLCWKCNTALGKLGDSVDGLLRAIDYLKRAQHMVIS